MAEMSAAAFSGGAAKNCVCSSTRRCQPVLLHTCRQTTAAYSCSQQHRYIRTHAAETDTQTSTPSSSSPVNEDLDKTTKKFGLEAGLLQALTNKNADGKSKAQQAKELLARYGSAYLITSISFAIVSFAVCYTAVSSGVDVSALLTKVGLQVTETSEQVGTVALAYAAHKALSPVRFPPTVALTPWVAKLLGREQTEDKPL